MAVHRPAEEFPLALTVNGVELATLIASPHDLAFLVGGFLRMQGLVRSADDILALSVCRDFGAAGQQGFSPAFPQVLESLGIDPTQDGEG